MLSLASYAVTLDEFINAKALEVEVNQTVEKFLALKKELATGKSLLLKANNLIANLKPYEKMANPFSFYKNTKYFFNNFTLNSTLLKL